MRTLILATLFAVGFARGASAEDKKAEPKVERITYRVTGLFDKWREKDLRAGFEEVPEITLVAINFDDAEVTLEFAPAKLFPGQKPERVTELVSDRLRKATHYTFALHPRRAVARDKLQQVVIPAAGLDCKACSLAAYEIVARVDGVYQATASFKEGRITALIDPAKTDKAALTELLRKRGVDVGPKKKK